MTSILLDACKKASVAYKTVPNHDIMADIFAPDAPDGKKKRPLLVRFHGGFLVTGARDFNDWLAPWLVDFALKHGAILVIPDYRLMPESKGCEILDDVDDFWKWTKTKLAGVVESLNPAVEVDFEKVLVTGESAGGWLSIQSGLSQPSFFKAVIAAYPMLDFKAPFFTEAYEKPLFGLSQLPASIITSHLENAPKDSIVSHVTPPARSDLAIAIVQQGRYFELFTQGDSDIRLFPNERLQEGAKLPPTFIYHAKEDSAVPVEGSRKFVDLAREKGLAVHFAEASGDHGFDNAIPKDDVPGWLSDGLEFVRKAWLGE